MTCSECRQWFEAAVEGSIGPDDRLILEEHVRQCPACRQEYDRLLQTEALLQAAFTPQTPARQAINTISERLSSQAAPAPLNATAAAGFWTWRRALSSAAAIALAVGLVSGYWIARLKSIPTAATTASGPVVPIQVADVKGSVLLKRASDRVWCELAAASALRVGDVFQASPNSQLTLSFEDGSKLVLAANSRLALDHYNGGIRLNLSAGRMWASLNSPHPPFFVSTPSGQLEALGTEFTVSVE
ncbi:MAG TPA: FecR domain-containing protein [Tepidisphaeraceae bacterium]|nr:FecR domain-containing protein [Tepidisphaeraceae bacterium]